MRASDHHGRSRRWGRLAPLLAGLALLLALAPALAHAQGTGADTLVLVWTAPGDDGTVGTASGYDMRMSTSPITDANFSSATAIASPPAPQPSGSRQQYIVHGLTRGTTYFFAIKSLDDAGNISPLSNVLRWDWVLDTAPPAAPTGVSATVEGTSVHVHWTANSEPDLAGYTVYRATSAGGTYTVISGSLVATNDYVDSALPAGATTLWYRVTATDGSGNESARSASASAVLSGGGPSAGTGTWQIGRVYPNPSQGGTSVSIEVAAPDAAEVQITDSGHRVVWHEAIAAGNQTRRWDGINEAGRPVAPGVYTVWLIGGGTRTSSKLVRVP